MDFVIITGMSGAGKTQTKKILEDLGFYCIDNLPPLLIEDFIHLAESNMEVIDKLAVVSDVRNKKFFKDLEEVLSRLDEKEIDYDIIFLDAKNETLINRYKETRRTHPLRPAGSIESGINEEREILNSIKERSNYVINTDEYTLTDLRTDLKKHFLKKIDIADINVNLISFGFKRGIPTEADYIFDVRFLKNPYYIEDLRLKTGNDQEVQTYVMSFEESQQMYAKVRSFLEFSIEACKKNSRRQITIGIGCTGGHHRSVTFVNKLYDDFCKKYSNISKEHRDIDE